MLQQFIFETGLSKIAPQKDDDDGTGWNEMTSGIRWSKDSRQVVYNHISMTMKERRKAAGKWGDWHPVDSQLYRDVVRGIYSDTNNRLIEVANIRLYRGVAGDYARKLVPGASVHETTLNSYTAKRSVAKYFADESITRGGGGSPVVIERLVAASDVWSFNGTPMPAGARTSEHEDEYTVLGRRLYVASHAKGIVRFVRPTR